MKRFLILVLILSFTLTLLAREPLTFEQRVKAQEAIEKVYYSHRIWPKENPQPKPPFERMVTREQIEAKVTDYLKKSAALDQFWQRPIEGKQLQAEMDRMAKGTKDPQTLNELFKALNDDPYLIAECLARPVLADRLVRNWYANDERFHKETREKVEEVLKYLTPENFCKATEGQYSRVTYRLGKKNNIERQDPEDRSIGLSQKEFEQLYAEIPEEGKISGIEETDESFRIKHATVKNEVEIQVEIISFQKLGVEDFIRRKKQSIVPVEAEKEKVYYLADVTESTCEGGWNNGTLDNVIGAREGHSAIWTGNEMIVWGGYFCFGVDYYLNSGGRYNPSTDIWTPTTLSGAPVGRYGHLAVWTGTEMIVWGGGYTSGGRYNPLTNNWIATSTINVPSVKQAAVWTGTEMIVWGGGTYITGGRYNPQQDTWSPTSIVGTPAGRNYPTMIWTGTEAIVWGGNDGTTGWGVNTGGRYNPSSDTWAAISMTNVPSPRRNHTAVWTGTEMIVWGGENGDGTGFNTGGRYNPATDNWTSTGTTYPPVGRYCHSSIWTGSEMVIWGGVDGIYELNSGSRYSPSTDEWNATSIINAPVGRTGNTAIWSGEEVIVWGGYFHGELDSGGRYNPILDTWVATATGGAPTYRDYTSSIWTGNEMIIWGGERSNNSTYYNSGSIYRPSTDTWEATPLSEAPSQRCYHTAVWTGLEMVVWGGENNTVGLLNTGGKYNPSSHTWATISTVSTPSARCGHTSIWTRNEMLIWGNMYNYDNTGGRYNPTSDYWTSISTIGAPSARTNHTAVWTGSEMIIWGGQVSDSNPYYTATGGRYNPTTDNWIPTSAYLWGRKFHSAVWTGTEMIIWGGLDGGNSGAIYSPSSDSWTSTSTGTNCPSSRLKHTAIWTGTEMIVWGGQSEWGFYKNLKDGARYNKVDNTWTAIPITNAPSERTGHCAVWTGNSMIVWGGEWLISPRSGGIYYPSLLAIPPFINGLDVNSCPSPTVSLSIPASYSTYQWNLDGSPISGATSNAYEATVSGSYTVSVTDSNGCSGTSDPHAVTITPCIPNIVYSSHGSFTQVTGDGDAWFEKGENWSIAVTVINTGNTPATNVIAALSGNGITVCNSTGSFGTIATGGTGTFTYNFVIDDDFTPCGGNINFNLGSKACTELTPAGTDETNLFSIQVGQITTGAPTDLILQPSTADSYVNQASAGTNYGSGTTMSVQSRISQAQRTLVMFDLSAIPEDSTINSATLELYASSAPTTGLTLNVHRITGTWTETGVTWTNQPAYNSTVDASLAGGTTTGWKIWNIASLVQGWVDGTNVNYGLIVKGSVENDKTALTYAFASKENATSGNRPILRINYTPPTTMNCDYIGSGECDAVLAECAPGNTYENGQAWSGMSQSWPALSGATGYKLYRGVQSGLRYLLTAENDSCLRYEGSNLSVDLSGDDPSGETSRLYWYIVTGTNGSGEGPAGNGRIVNSSGNCE